MVRIVFNFIFCALCFTSQQALAASAACPRAGTLGVSRTVEIDTSGGPGFGFEHYKAIDFLQPKEVVLTFDDGPQKFSTGMILAALADQCVKATFFAIGKMALGYPEIIREVAKAGHTIGTHTWGHQQIPNLKTFEEQEDEIERGVSGVKRAVGGPVAPFFRYPALRDNPETLAHFAKRGIAIFSTDIDSFDFKPQPADRIVKTVMTKLEKRGKGIILMHDIHKTTAKALPALLTELKAKGYKIVHLKAKAQVATLAEYDQRIEKDAKGLPAVGAERTTASIVKTIEGAPADDEIAAQSAQPEPARDGGEGEGAAPQAVGRIEPSSAASAPPAQAQAAVQSAAQPPASVPVAEAAPVAAAQSTPAATAQETPAVVATGPLPSAAPPVTGSIAPGASAGSAGNGTGNPDAGALDSDESEPKSFSERARDLWEYWFGR